MHGPLDYSGINQTKQANEVGMFDYRKQSGIKLVVIALAVLVCAPVFAQLGDGGRDIRLQGVKFAGSPFQSAGMSLEQAVAMVQSRYGARALKFNTVEEEGRQVHYIRLITADKSRVWTVRVDAATGREF